MESTSPITAIMFKDNVKQVLWHPSLPTNLVITTVQKDPTIYICHAVDQAPAIADVPIRPATKGTGRFKGTFIQTDMGRNCLFMLTSPEAFEVGFIEPNDGTARFNSVGYEEIF